MLAVPLAIASGPARHAQDPYTINAGQLHFLAHPPGGPIDHQVKHITILPDSLRTGWVQVEQCHYDLDAVPAMQVVFGKGVVRHLRVTRADHIRHAWVQGSTVQLADVKPHAVLCLRSENRVLRHFADAHRYLLLSGPFMRRFLDGYFPMRVDVDVEYPAHQLTLARIDPPGLTVSDVKHGHVKLEALFEGRLMIGVQFASVGIQKDTTPQK